MKLEPAETVQWDVEGGGVGRVLRTHEGWALSSSGLIFQPKNEQDSRILVRRIHTGELVLVPGNSLQPYPAEPIPQPEK